jgi:hypothetical protein
MTSINSKMGLKPAGQRDMMKLPKDRAAAAAITSAKCPACQHTGARASKTQPGALYCTWCNTIWQPPA